VVWYDYEARKSVALPDELRRRIEAMRVPGMDPGDPAATVRHDRPGEP
jgi:hypothetical protein